MPRIRYGCLTVLNLVFTLFAYLGCNWWVPLFASEDGWLPNWLTWLQTFDASLDAGWRDGYYKRDTVPWWERPFVYLGGTPSRANRYWMRVRWLYRNAAYGFCYWPLGIPFVAEDWVVDRYTEYPDGTHDFEAHTKDGRHFCVMLATGLKLGWKASHMWTGTGWSTTPWGPEMRIPLCFTPRGLL